MEYFLDESVRFQSFTGMHYHPIWSLGILLMLIFRYTSHWEQNRKFQLAFYLSLLPALTVFIRLAFVISQGKFKIEDDLPLHLCRLAALLYPVFFYFKNEKWIKILYFLVMAGTLQGLITPDLIYAWPHFTYPLYWVMHVVLVGVAIYSVSGLGLKPTWKDIGNTLIYGNAIFISTIFINIWLGSNYFFSARKPVTGSILDLMGPWPWYLLVMEIIAFLLFIIAFLPFMAKKGSSE